MITLFNQAFKQALNAIDQAHAEMRLSHQSPDSSTICSLLQLAVTHGAPIYNRNGRKACAGIYLHMAKGLVDLLPQDENVRCCDSHAILRQFAYQQLRPLIVDNPTVPASELAANNLAWDLRHSIDRIITVAVVLAAAIKDIDIALESARNSSRELDITKIKQVLEIAIHYGAPIYNIGACKGCGYIYLRTAHGILGLLSKNRHSGIPDLVQASLSPLCAANPAVPAAENAADKLAWELRHVFDHILDMNT